MDSSVYLAFDPATGQFVSKTKSTTDGNQTVDTGIDVGQPSDVQPTTVTANTDKPVPPVQQASVETAVEQSPSPNWLFAGSAVLLVLLGGFFVFRKRSPATNG